MEEARAVVFLDKLRATLNSGDFKKQDHLVERLLEEGFSSTDIASALMHQLQVGDSAPSTRNVSRERDPVREEARGRSVARNDGPAQPPWNKDRPTRRDELPARPRPVVVPEGVRVREESSHVVTPRPGKPKKSGRPSVEQTRIWMNVGEAMGILPIDVVNAVAGQTGLPGKVVGTIDVRERHLFADVSSEHASAIIEKLHRSEIKGHKIKVKLA